MRIISKFKDYYDSASAYGVDPEILYVREQKDILLNVRSEPSWSTRKSEVHFGKFQVIGFCGIIIPFQVHELDNIRHVIWGDEAVRKEPFNVSWRQIRTANDPIWKDDSWFKSKYKWGKNPQDIFNDLKNNQRLLDIFMENRVPLFHCRGKYDGGKLIVHLNPSLKELEFMGQRDAVTAFSEIFQYVGNVLVQDTQVDVPTGSNDVVARSKGFDQNSFKKDPIDKKHGRKQRKNRI